jgi:hypothetical protein
MLSLSKRKVAYAGLVLLLLGLFGLIIGLIITYSRPSPSLSQGPPQPQPDQKPGGKDSKQNAPPDETKHSPSEPDRKRYMDLSESLVKRNLEQNIPSDVIEGEEPLDIIESRPTSWSQEESESEADELPEIPETVLHGLVQEIERFIDTKSSETQPLFEKLDSVRGIYKKDDEKYASCSFSKEFIEVFLESQSYDKAKFLSIISKGRWKPWVRLDKGIPQIHMGEFPDKNVREFNHIPYLPNHIRPLHYDLHIRKTDNSDKFSGDVTISVEFLHDSDFIVLNIDDLFLVITDCRFCVPLDPQSVVGRSPEWKIHRTGQVVIIDLLKTYSQETVGELTLKYSGQLNKIEALGFYNSRERDQNLFTTHFETILARKAFRWFDEP